MKRPINEQTVVITGASSGIGRATALEFGRHGARVVLAARNEVALHAVAVEVERLGGRAHVVVTDTADAAQVNRLAEEAVNAFGGIDTWVNNAAVYLVGTVADTPVEDFERLIQVNVMGYIYGVKAALPHLIRQGTGAIINVGSATSVRAFPLIAAYSASKQAIRGITEALRLELEREHPGISVTLILPASINTPLFDHARVQMDVEPRPLPPIYEPQVVADAIVHAAQHPLRSIYIGPGRVLALQEGIAPSLVDNILMLGDFGVKIQRTDRPNRGEDNFDRPLPGPGSIRGHWGDKARPDSLVTRTLELHPGLTAAALATVALGVLALRRQVRPQ